MGRSKSKATKKAEYTKVTIGESLDPKKKSTTKTSSSFLLSAIPVVLAIAVALYYRQNDKNGTQDVSQSSSKTRQLLNPQKGTWTEGYYTTDAISDQSYPSTHALLYQNGGVGEPTMIEFSNDDEFLKLGRVYNDKGQIVQSPTHFRNGTALYKGPTTPGTHFQWPAVSVGYKRTVPGVVGGNGKQIELETLTEPSANAKSSDPRIFYIHNFLSGEEADEFIRFSTAEENPYKMAPSTGGTHKAWNQGGADARLSTRTSENAFDITTKNSKTVKQRAFRLLRMGGYLENLADGIQILRYEIGQAYTAHHDYFPKYQSDDHQWDPSKGGSNRFATIFLYLSDVEYGGETAFPNIDRLTADKSKELVDRLGEAPPLEDQKTFVKEAGLKEGSWEEHLSRKCYTKFAVPPRRGDAILFYSQRPDGHLDHNSLHGACPVLKGQKWGANLWVWNACRFSQCKGDPLHPADELPDTMKAPYGGGQ